MTTSPTPPVARIAMVTLDCADPEASATFWAGLLGWTIAHSQEEYAMLVDPAGGPGAALGFGKVEGYQPPVWPDEGGRKQFHLDLAVEDLDTAQAAAVELGATLADPQPGETWRVLFDPAGHPFCLTPAANWG